MADKKEDNKTYELYRRWYTLIFDVFKKSAQCNNFVQEQLNNPEYIENVKKLYKDKHFSQEISENDIEKEVRTAILDDAHQAVENYVLTLRKDEANEIISDAERKAEKILSDARSDAKKEKMHQADSAFLSGIVLALFIGILVNMVTEIIALFIPNNDYRLAILIDFAVIAAFIVICIYIFWFKNIFYKFISDDIKQSN